VLRLIRVSFTREYTQRACLVKIIYNVRGKGEIMYIPEYITIYSYIFMQWAVMYKIYKYL